MKSALVIIDVQMEYSKNGNIPLNNYEKMIVNINNIEEDYDFIINVIHKNTEGMLFVDGTDGIRFDNRITKRIDKSFIKNTPDTFDSTDLEKYLEHNNVENLTLVGAMTQNCVTYTAFGAKKRDYNVTIISDCCATINDVVQNFALRALASKQIKIK